MNIENDAEDKGFDAAFDELATGPAGDEAAAAQEGDAAPSGDGEAKEELGEAAPDHSAELIDEIAGEDGAKGDDVHDVDNDKKKGEEGAAAAEGDGTAPAGDQPAGAEPAGDEPAGKAKDERPSSFDPKIWADAQLSPEQKAELHRLRSMAGRAETLARSEADLRRRYSGASRRIDELQRQIPKPADTAGEEGQGEGAEAQNPLESAEIKAFEAEYPEVAGPLLNLLKSQQRQIEELGGAVKPVVEDRQRGEVASQTSTEIELLSGSHPDWNEAVSSKEFDDWAVSAPAHIQALILANAERITDHTQVDTVLTEFKARTGFGKQVDEPAGGEGEGQNAAADVERRRERQMQGGRGAINRGAGAAAGTPDEFDAAWDVYAGKSQRRA